MPEQDWEDITPQADDEWEDVTPTPSVSAEPAPTSKFQQMYELTFNAPKFITEPARKFAESTMPGMDWTTDPTIPEWIRKPAAMAKGFYGGTVEGAAGQATPANILTLGRGKALTTAGRLMGGAQAVHGVGELQEGNIAQGLGEIGFGALGTVLPLPVRKPGLGKITPTAGTPAAATPVPSPKPTVPEGGGIFLGKPSVVNIKRASPEFTERLRQEGYVPAGVGPTGKPQWVRSDLVAGAKPTEGAKPITPAAPVSPVAQGGKVPFHREIPIKKPTKQAIKNLQLQGYALEETRPDGTSIFRYRPAAPKPGERVPFKRTTSEVNIEDIMPQEMRVKGVRTPPGMLENVAVGGADPRVLDVLGSSLYSRRLPVVTAKELLQNAFDEIRETGNQAPVKVVLGYDQKNPRTGEKAEAITFRDQGRGVSLDQIYTVLTDVGKTGKAGVQSASGGFGIAKAAPFLGGKYARIVSIVDEGGERIRYTFEGTPAEFKNQALGVPISREVIDPEIPTGLEVTTYFKERTPGFMDAQKFIKNMTELSTDVPATVEFVNVFGDVEGSSKYAREFLDETPAKPLGRNNPLIYQREVFKQQTAPPIQDVVETPGAKVNIRYAEPEPGFETAAAPIHIMNKGLYQVSEQAQYGMEAVPNVPKSIIADVVSKVEEGDPEYPFSANREQLNENVNNAIKEWVYKNIITGVQQKLIKRLQQQYDGITTLLSTKGKRAFSFYDDGNRLNSDEINLFKQSPEFQKVSNIIDEANQQILKVADTLGWTNLGGGPGWVPSNRLKKFGVLFRGPDRNGDVTLGIHIPRADDPNDSAILVNIMEHLNQAVREADPLNTLTTDLYTTLTHEQAHVPGGGHDKGFAYRHAKLLAQLGRRDTKQILDKFAVAFGDAHGGINPKLSELLRVYNESRGRQPTSKSDAFLSTGIDRERRANITGGKGGGFTGPSAGKIKPRSLGREAYNLSRGAVTTWDLSAPLRQGLPMITRKEFWTSLDDMFKARGSEEGFRTVMDEIESDPIFQQRINTKTGKILPSFAKKAGLDITELGYDLSKREESMMSKLIEKVPGVRASNRAYTAYLNKLRADSFKNLVYDAQNYGLNPFSDDVLAREIADYVNTATGRGPLKVVTPSLSLQKAKIFGKERKIPLKERSLEKNAEFLTDTLFSPRLFTSRMRMLNPGTYIMASPFVRKQYTRSILGVAGAWMTFATLAKLAGAEVSLDPNSADFGKAKIGDTRVDPAGGFQQFLVAASRLVSGKTTTSATGEEFNLGEGYKATTRKDVIEQFGTNKLHPVLKFAYDWLNASEYKPFHLGDRVAQLFVPLIVQDIIELAKQDPTLIPFVLPPVAFGMGTQTYEPGQYEPTLVPESMDITYPRPSEEF